MKSPAASSSTSETAICATTSERPSGMPAVPRLDAPLTFNAGSGSIPAARSAGRSPNTNAVAHDRRHREAEHAPSGLASIAIGSAPDISAASHPRAPGGQQQSCSAAERGKQHGLGKALADQSPSARADGQAHGGLPALRRRAREHQASRRSRMRSASTRPTIPIRIMSGDDS